MQAQKDRDNDDEKEEGLNQSSTLCCTDLNFASLIKSYCRGMDQEQAMPKCKMHCPSRNNVLGVKSFLLLVALVLKSEAFVLRSGRDKPFRYQRLGSTRTTDYATNESSKERLLSLISSTPSNAPTSKDLTREILATVRELEAECPTPDSEVVPELAGNWELLWTAQDQSSDEWGLGPLRRFIKYEF